MRDHLRQRFFENVSILASNPDDECAQSNVRKILETAPPEVSLEYLQILKGNFDFEYIPPLLSLATVFSRHHSHGAIRDLFTMAIERAPAEALSLPTKGAEIEGNTVFRELAAMVRDHTQDEKIIELAFSASRRVLNHAYDVSLKAPNLAYIGTGDNALRQFALAVALNPDNAQLIELLEIGNEKADTKTWLTKVTGAESKGDTPLLEVSAAFSRMSNNQRMQALMLSLANRLPLEEWGGAMQLPNGHMTMPMSQLVSGLLQCQNKDFIEQLSQIFLAQLESMHWLSSVPTEKIERLRRSGEMLLKLLSELVEYQLHQWKGKAVFVAQPTTLFSFALYGVLKDCHAASAKLFGMAIQKVGNEWFDSPMTMILGAEKVSGKRTALSQKLGIEFVLDILEILLQKTDDYAQSLSAILLKSLQDYLQKVKNGEWEFILNEDMPSIFFKRMSAYSDQKAVFDVLKLAIVKISVVQVKNIVPFLQTQQGDHVRVLLQEAQKRLPIPKPQPKPKLQPTQKRPSIPDPLLKPAKQDDVGSGYSPAGLLPPSLGKDSITGQEIIRWADAIDSDEEVVTPITSNRNAFFVVPIDQDKKEGVGGANYCAPTSSPL